MVPALKKAFNNKCNLSLLTYQSNGSMTPLQLRLVCLHMLFTYCRALVPAPDLDEQAGTSASLTDSGNLVKPYYTSVPYNSTGFTPTNLSSLQELINPQTTNSSNAGLSCNGNTYGFNVPVGSCIDAYRQIPDDTINLIFAPRHTVSCDVGLPLRWISCMLLLYRSDLRAGFANFSDSRWTLHYRCTNQRI